MEEGRKTLDGEEGKVEVDNERQITLDKDRRPPEPEDEEMDLLAIQQDFRADSKAPFGSDNGDDFSADDRPEQIDTEEL